MASIFTITCPCLFGLESVLAGEIKRLGGQNVEALDGRVSFKGEARMIARANINLRTAERVLIVLGQFRASSFEELFQGVYSIGLENFIGKNDAYPVKGWSKNSELKSIPDCQAIIKKAASKRLGEHYNVEWLEETGSVHQIQFSIMKDVVSIMLDTTGRPLHKRGYRIEANIAPIKETLAAGIIDLARINEDTLLIDPMCGSGTMLIEGAEKALNVPAGLKRRFASESWGLIPETDWSEERQQGFEKVKRNAAFRAKGFDIDPDSVRLVNENAQRAGVASKIEVSQADISSFVPPDEPFVLITNPPYGERMSDLDQARELYKIMGERFLPAAGRSYYIISPDEQFEKHFGRQASKRRKLYNGMIKCQLYMYF